MGANLRTALIIVLIHNLVVASYFTHKYYLRFMWKSFFLSILGPSSSIFCLFHTWEKQERKRNHHLLRASFSAP